MTEPSDYTGPNRACGCCTGCVARHTAAAAAARGSSARIVGSDKEKCMTMVGPWLLFFRVFLPVRTTYCFSVTANYLYSRGHHTQQATTFSPCFQLRDAASPR